MSGRTKTDVKFRDVHETVVDGVTVLWADAPGDFEAELLFRVGWADESLATRGLTHTAEHLVSAPLERTPYESAGFVRPIETGFWAEGSRDEVLSFLRGICAGICNPPLDALERELRILRTEAASDANDSLALLKLERFGARTHGLCWFREHGLYRPFAGSEVADWISDWFTADNAILWLSGPPPDRLELSLPQGRRIAPPEPSWSGATTPSVVQDDWGEVALTLVGERLPALRVAIQHLANTLEDILRHREGLSYAVDSWFEPLGADRIHAALDADTLDEHAQAVTDLVIETLHRLGSTGVPEDELRDRVQSFEETIRDPQSVRALLAQTASDRLLGNSAPSEEERYSAVRALTSEATAEALSRALATSTLLVPEAVAPPAGLFVIPRFGSTVDPIPADAPRPGVWWSSARVARIFDDAGRDVVGFSWDECENVFAWPDGIRTIIATDGRAIEINPDDFEEAGEMMRELDDVVPEAKFVRLAYDVP